MLPVQPLQLCIFGSGNEVPFPALGLESQLPGVTTAVCLVD